MTKKYQLLLLDANIIIKLCELGRWDQFLERCDVYISSIVRDEAEFFVKEGERYEIEIPENTPGVTFFDVEISATQAFLRHFDPTYADRLDPGELEALTYMFQKARRGHS